MFNLAKLLIEFSKSVPALKSLPLPLSFLLFLSLSLNTNTHHLSSLFSLDMLDLFTVICSVGMSGLSSMLGM